MKSKLLFAAVTALSVTGFAMAHAESNGFSSQDKAKVMSTARQSTLSESPDVTGTMKKRHRKMHGTNGSGSKPMSTRGIPGKPVNANEQGKK